MITIIIAKTTSLNVAFKIKAAKMSEVLLEAKSSFVSRIRYEVDNEMPSDYGSVGSQR